jgi:hypothetical protein
MRQLFLRISILCLLAMALPAVGADGRVVKVLPHFLDLKGKHTLSPSLYGRDAYQVFLREHPEERSGIRFDMQWKAGGPATEPLKLRVELRGTTKGDLPSKSVLEKAIKPRGWFSHWTSVSLTGEDYRNFGEMTAWRATLWEGDLLLSEQHSFLW